MVHTSRADDAAAADWQPLFDGTSIDAWRGYNSEALPDTWKIVDGTLEGNGGGDIVTKDKFENFEFEFEWKIAPNGNSGVMYRVVETPEPSYFTGPEYQVLDNPSYNITNTAPTASGALYEMYPPAVDAAKPAGEWNTGRIVVNQNHVEHWLNGQKLVDATIGSDDWNDRLAKSKFSGMKGFAKTASGHLCLQDHGSQVWYRNMRIRRLGEQQAASDKPLRVLFVTQSGGFRHSTVTRKASDLSHTERIMMELGSRTGKFRVNCTQDVETDFKRELIENYDIVMFFTTGTISGKTRLPIDQETLDWFLNDWLQRPGHGFLGVHAAADTYADYQPYWDMIGGSFDGHPWTADTTVTIKVHDTTHPLTAAWDDSFVITDEIYQFKNWQPEKVRVLMSLDMARTDLKKPYHVPVMWVKQYGQGRAMHMSLGHREDVWSNPKYQETLITGIRWLAGQIEGDAKPNPEVSAAEDAAAKEVVEGKKAA